MDYVRSLAATLVLFLAIWIAVELVQRIIVGVLS